jgi:hypothetical protein
MCDIVERILRKMSKWVSKVCLGHRSERTTDRTPSPFSVDELQDEEDLGEPVSDGSSSKGNKGES